MKDNRIYGAYGFDVNEEIFYVIHAKAVICATGGAAGLTVQTIRAFQDIKCGTAV